MNIKPQEVVKDGVRTVQYKGSDGKKHDFSAKLPDGAAIPVVGKRVIAAGTEITLAEAHAIEGFDIRKVASLRLSDSFSLYSNFSINMNESDEGSGYLFLSYQGRYIVMYKKVDGQYVQAKEGLTSVQINDKSELAALIFEIAQQTNYLVTYNSAWANGHREYEANYYDEEVILTYSEDIVLYGDDFEITSPNGVTRKVLTDKNQIEFIELSEIEGLLHQEEPGDLDQACEYIMHKKQESRNKLFFTKEGLIATQAQISGLPSDDENNDGAGANIDFCFLNIYNGVVTVEYLSFYRRDDSWSKNEESGYVALNENNGISPVLVPHVTKTQEGSVITYEVDTSHDEVYEALGNGIMPLYIMKHIFKEDGCDDVITFSQMKIERATADVIIIADMNSGVEYNHVNQTVALYEP